MGVATMIFAAATAERGDRYGSIYLCLVLMSTVNWNNVIVRTGLLKPPHSRRR